MNKTKNFVIWLDGFLEACQERPTKNQTKIIKDKLNSIFEHEADKFSKEKTNHLPPKRRDPNEILY